VESSLADPALAYFPNIFSDGPCLSVMREMWEMGCEQLGSKGTFMKNKEETKEMEKELFLDLSHALWQAGSHPSTKRDRMKLRETTEDLRVRKEIVERFVVRYLPPEHPLVDHYREVHGEEEEKDSSDEQEWFTPFDVSELIPGQKTTL